MNSFFSRLIVTTVIAVPHSHACDLCSVYTAPTTGTQPGDPGTHVGIAEQFTRFGSLRDDGHEVSNPADQYLDSSITRIVLGKSVLADRLTLQANIPLIHRDYRRPEHDDIEEGTESGLGDISLLATYEVYRLESSEPRQSAKDAKSVLDPSPSRDLEVSVNLFAGIKLPTGDSSRLKEEAHEDHEHDDGDAPESGIHGHDLALGSGSVDGLIGGDVCIRSGNWFVQGNLQYTLRSEGDYDYRYANDLIWSCGPGFYLLRENLRSFALQCVLSGETKDTDHSHGETADDTGITAVYLGPRILGSYGDLDGEIGLDLPIVLDNTALQIVPEYRIRAAINWRF